ncbi:unnamed protein product, partial [Ectocarpus sp. 12 AP-2014]
GKRHVRSGLKSKAPSPPPHARSSVTVTGRRDAGGGLIAESTPARTGSASRKAQIKLQNTSAQDGSSKLTCPTIFRDPTDAPAGGEVESDNLSFEGRRGGDVVLGGV